MCNAKKPDARILNADTVSAASIGDADALHAILKHYEGYILALSAVRVYGDDGTPYVFIDEALRRELELRLISKAVGFRLKPAV